MSHPSTDAALTTLLIDGLHRRATAGSAAALVDFEQACQRYPQSLPAILLSIAMLLDLGRYRQAWDALDTLPRTRQGQRDAALLRWRLGVAALSCTSTRRDTQLEAIEILARLKQADAALARCDVLLAQQPHDPDVLRWRAHLLAEQERYDDALAAYDRLPNLAHDALLRYNRATVLQRLQRYDDAIAQYEQALNLHPDFAEAEMESALCHLAQGDYAQGWPRFEARWRTQQLRTTPIPSTQPRWLGQTALARQRILLWHEQGYGDTLQFVRFALQVAQQAAQTLLLVPSPLSSLLKTLPATITVLDETAVLPPHDYHCPLMSLPLALGLTTPEQVRHPPYLTADVDSATRWAARLGPPTRLRVGLAWCGRQLGGDARRTLTLAQLRPLFTLPLDLVSLQKQLPPVDAAHYPTLPWAVHAGEQLTDFADTAGLIANLDIVVTVDTVIAHLAGALGKTVWILLPHTAEWRWLQGRSDTPWYASARLWRQSRHGDWAGVVTTLQMALSEQAAAQRRHG